MQETANKQKRITQKALHEMLNGMSVELAEKVHLLFMANDIDYSDYDFRNENQVESYCWCYRDLFELKTKESQEIVNSQLIEFLDEWRKDAPSRYRKAKDDICYWITDEWYSFESPMQKEIESGSPLPIHRHQKTSETVVCIRGRLVEEFYDDLERTCTERIELSPNGPVVALNIPAGQWHTVRALESGTVIIEMKNGPYEPLGAEDVLMVNG